MIFSVIAIFILSLSVFAQSGQGVLKGFVTAGIRDSSAIAATVELRAIKNWSKTESVETIEAKDGYYEFETSFGNYLLTISAKGYEPYQTKVFIPSSSTLSWGTLLERTKSRRKGKGN